MLIGIRTCTTWFRINICNDADNIPKILCNLISLQIGCNQCRSWSCNHKLQQEMICTLVDNKYKHEFQSHKTWGYKSTKLCHLMQTSTKFPSAIELHSDRSEKVLLSYTKFAPLTLWIRKLLPIPKVLSWMNRWRKFCLSHAKLSPIIEFIFGMPFLHHKEKSVAPLL